MFVRVIAMSLVAAGLALPALAQDATTGSPNVDAGATPPVINQPIPGDGNVTPPHKINPIFGKATPPHKILPIGKGKSPEITPPHEVNPIVGSPPTNTPPVVTPPHEGAPIGGGVGGIEPQGAPANQ